MDHLVLAYTEIIKSFFIDLFVCFFYYYFTHFAQFFAIEGVDVNYRGLARLPPKARILGLA